MKGYIYKYTFPDGKVYIGQTRRDPKIRQMEHIDPVIGPSNRGFWSAYQKFGEYQYEIIYTIERNCVDDLVEELNRLESLCIINHKAYDENFGYNIRMFGTSHTNKRAILDEKFNEFMRQLLPTKLSMYYAIKEKVFNTQEYLTEKEKKYLEKQSNVFQIHSMPHNCMNINKVIKNDRIVKNNVALELFFDEMEWRLSDEIREYVFAFIQENEREILEKYRDDHMICQIDENNNVIATYDSCRDAAIALGKNSWSSIRDTVAGKWKQAYGYKWKLKKDLNQEIK